MALFDKKRGGVDMVDFTKTRHGKPIPKPADEPGVVFDGSFIDLTQSQQSQTTPTQDISSPTMQVHSDMPSTFGFLSDFAQAAASDSTSMSNSPSASDRLTNPDAEVSALRIKIDDLEYKIERLLERLSEMETKVGRV